MSQSVRLNSHARENIHSITNSHKKISSLNDLHRKICICQFFFVPLRTLCVQSQHRKKKIENNNYGKEGIELERYDGEMVQ